MEELLRNVLARIGAEPTQIDAILAEYAEPLIAFLPNREMIAANPSAERMFGFGSGGLLGLPTDTLVPPRLRQPDPPPMQHFDTLTTGELPGQLPDGAEKPLSWTVGSCRGPPGNGA